MTKSRGMGRRQKLRMLDWRKRAALELLRQQERNRTSMSE